MIHGISGNPIPAVYPEPYRTAITEACGSVFPPCLAAAVAYHESVSPELSGWLAATYGKGTTAANVISGDGGHGLFQLTSSYPSTWADVKSNASYAVQHFLTPALETWSGRYGLEGDDLVRAIAAQFNAGYENALSGHLHGNVGEYTTDHYDLVVLGMYVALSAGRLP